MERPKVTVELIREAANRLAERNRWSEQMAADIAGAYREGMDGYRLARQLEDVCGWEISSSDVDDLDGMESDVRLLHRAACRVWADENNVQPPLAVGTMITRGEITGIFEHEAACYLVRNPREADQSRREIVRFEDARVVSQEVA